MSYDLLRGPTPLDPVLHRNPFLWPKPCSPLPLLVRRWAGQTCPFRRVSCDGPVRESHPSRPHLQMDGAKRLKPTPPAFVSPALAVLSITLLGKRPRSTCAATSRPRLTGNTPAGMGLRPKFSDKERRSRLVTALPLPSERAASLGCASPDTTPAPCLPLCGRKLAGLMGSSPCRSRSGLVESNHTTGRWLGVRPYTPHLICALSGESGFVSPVMRD